MYEVAQWCEVARLYEGAQWCGVAQWREGCLHEITFFERPADFETAGLFNGDAVVITETRLSGKNGHKSSVEWFRNVARIQANESAEFLPGALIFSLSGERQL